MGSIEYLFGDLYYGVLKLTYSTNIEIISALGGAEFLENTTIWSRPDKGESRAEPSFLERLLNSLGFIDIEVSQSRENRVLKTFFELPSGLSSREVMWQAGQNEEQTRSVFAYLFQCGYEIEFFALDVNHKVYTLSANGILRLR